MLELKGRHTWEICIHTLLINASFKYSRRDSFCPRAGMRQNIFCTDLSVQTFSFLSLLVKEAYSSRNTSTHIPSWNCIVFLASFNHTVVTGKTSKKRIYDWEKRCTQCFCVQSIITDIYENTQGRYFMAKANVVGSSLAFVETLHYIYRNFSYLVYQEWYKWSWQTNRNTGNIVYNMCSLV